MCDFVLLVFCFLFYQRMCTLFQKMQFHVCFLKMFRSPKRLICFILNTLHFPMVEGIAFYALHQSRLLIIPCKADDFCFFLSGYQKKFKKKIAWYRYSISNLIFSLFCGVTLRKRYIIEAKWSVILKNLYSVLKKNFFFGYKTKRSKYKVENVAIWQHFLINDKHRLPLF